MSVEFGKIFSDIEWYWVFFFKLYEKYLDCFVFVKVYIIKVFVFILCCSGINVIVIGNVEVYVIVEIGVFVYVLIVGLVSFVVYWKLLVLK